MLIDYSIKNFKSIKEQMILSFIANKDSKKQEILYKSNIKNFKLLPNVAIYGYNGSGKSNLIESMKLFKKIVSISHFPKEIINKKNLNISKYKLSDESLNSETEFKIRFIYRDTIYIYGFDIGSNYNITKEYLYIYKTQKSSLIFERKENSLILGASISDDRLRKQIKNLLDPTKLVIGIGHLFMVKHIKDAYEWILKKLEFIDEDFTDIQKRIVSLDKTISYLEKEEHKALFKEFLLNFLNKNSFEDIKEIEAKRIEKILDDNNLPEEIKKRILEARENFEKLEFEDVVLKESLIKEVRVITNILRESDNLDKEIKFNFLEESKGTQKLIAMFGYIYDSILNKKVLIVDEMSSALHPTLAASVINLFEKKQESQLIITTHNTELLELIDYRRDQIYIMDKQNNQSTLYSVSDIKNVRKEENLRIGYLSGKYGGVNFD